MGKQSPYLERPPPGYDIVRDGDTIIAHEKVECTNSAGVGILVLGVAMLAVAATMPLYLTASQGSLGGIIPLSITGVICCLSSLLLFSTVKTRIGFDTLSVRMTRHNAALPCALSWLNSVKEHRFTDFVVTESNYFEADSRRWSSDCGESSQPKYCLSFTSDEDHGVMVALGFIDRSKEEAKNPAAADHQHFQFMPRDGAPKPKGPDGLTPLPSVVSGPAAEATPATAVCVGPAAQKPTEATLLCPTPATTAEPAAEDSAATDDFEVKKVTVGSIAGEVKWAKAPWSDQDPSGEEKEAVSPMELVAFWRGYTNYLRSLVELPALTQHVDQDEEAAVHVPLSVAKPQSLRLRRALEAAFGITPAQEHESAVGVPAGADKGRLILSGGLGVAQDACKAEGEERAEEPVNGSVSEIALAARNWRILFIIGCVMLFFAVVSGGLFAYFWIPSSFNTPAIFLTMGIVFVLIDRKHTTTVGITGLLPEPRECGGEVKGFSTSYLTPCRKPSPHSTAFIDWSSVVVERSDVAAFHGLPPQPNSDEAPAPDTAPTSDDASPRSPYNTLSTPTLPLQSPTEATMATVNAAAVVMAAHHSQIPEVTKKTAIFVPAADSVTQSGDWTARMVGPPAGCDAGREAVGKAALEQTQHSPFAGSGRREANTRIRLVVMQRDGVCGCFRGIENNSQRLTIGVEVTTTSAAATAATPGLAGVVVDPTAVCQIATSDVVPVAWGVAPSEAARTIRRFERMFVGLSLLGSA